MGLEMPGRSRTVRVRHAGPWVHLAGQPIFRIIDQNGVTLRVIREAHDPQEALALYWRAVGTGLTGTTMSKDLDQRINRARMTSPKAQDVAEPIPELPFAVMPPDLAAARRPSRPARAREPVSQEDLFGSPDAADAVRTAAEPISEAREPEPPAPPANDRDPEPTQDDGRKPESRTLDPQTIMLSRVNPGNLRPTDRADSYLYHVIGGADAITALHQGLVVSATDPIILTERQGVAYWLSVLAEDYDFILDGPADFAVLRMRRHAVVDLLEPDPVASRNAGCPCFLLTGGRTIASG